MREKETGVCLIIVIAITVTIQFSVIYWPSTQYAMYGVMNGDTCTKNMVYVP